MRMGSALSTKGGKFLKPGKNHIEIEVTNLPANRIAELDRQGVQWRKFKEINIVDLNYRPVIMDIGVHYPPA